MALVPNQLKITVGENITITPAAREPSRTYAVNFDTGRIVGFIDGQEAMKQAILKILLTERFSYLIYSWNYGAELNAVIGKSYPIFESEIKRVICEALLADSRINSVSEFKVDKIDKRNAAVSFIANTIFGDIAIDKVVEL